MMDSHNLAACGLATGSALIGAISHYNAKKAMRELTPAAFLFYRIFAGVGILLVLSLAFERPALLNLGTKLDAPTVALLIGIFMLMIGIGCWLYFQGLKVCDLGTMATAMNTSPIFMLIFSLLFLGERPSWLGLAGEVVACLGLLYLGKVAADERHHTDEGRNRWKGLLYGLGGAFSTAGGLVLLVKLTARGTVSGLTLTFAMLLPGILFFGIVGWRGGSLNITRRALLHTISSGVLSWGIGLYFAVAAFQLTTMPSVVTLCMALNMVFGVLIGWLLLGERLGRRKVGAFAVIVCGVFAVVFFRRPANLPQQTTPPDMGALEVAIDPPIMLPAATGPTLKRTAP